MRLNFLKITFFFGAFLISCCNQNPKINKKQETFSDTIIKQLPKHEVYKTYAIPLPIEVFDSLKVCKRFDINALSKINNYKNVYSSWQNAVLLGIYTADLAYCAEFSNGLNLVNYSEICGKLSNELEIPDSYGKKYIVRLEQNINKRDSIIYITNLAYWQTCNLLQNNGIDNLLPLVVFGGWIESLSIVAKLTPSETEILIKTQYEIDKLIAFLYDSELETSAYRYNSNIQKIIKNLKILKSAYIKYNIDSSTTSYKLIVNKILDIRQHTLEN